MDHDIALTRAPHFHFAELRLDPELVTCRESHGPIEIASGFLLMAAIGREKAREGA
jgi:hypothetical protein